MKFSTLLIVIVVPLAVRAQLGGSHTFPLLNIPGSARAAALGGNYLAMKDGDLNLCIANPSLLDSLTHKNVSLSYVDYFAGGNFGYVSYGHTIKNRISLAGSVQFMSFGQEDETDASGQITGKFSAGDYIFNVGAGYRFDSLFTIGGNLKFIYSNIANQFAYGAAVDFAVTYHQPVHNFAASLVLRNAGVQFDGYNDEGSTGKLPTELQLGITKRLKHAPFRFNVVAENLKRWDLRYNDPNTAASIDPITGEVVDARGWVFGDKLMRHIVLGSEFLISENFQVRIGYNYRRRTELKVFDRPGMAGFSYGFGLRVNRFQLSYGRAIYHLAGPSNHFNITTNLNNW